MTKKISFLFICLMAFALGYSINNIAISDTAPKIAVVDVQKIVQNSSQVKQLKTDQEKKLSEMQTTIQKAQSGKFPLCAFFTWILHGFDRDCTLIRYDGFIG